jgi:hypothetical protein
MAEAIYYTKSKNMQLTKQHTFFGLAERDGAVYHTDAYYEINAYSLNVSFVPKLMEE